MPIQSQAILIGLKKTGNKGKTKFVINDSDKRWASSVIANIKPWLLEHYQMSREFSNYQTAEAMPDRSELSGLDAVYYHIYGDFRLVTTQRDATRLPHRTPMQGDRPIPRPTLRFKTFPLHTAQGRDGWRRENRVQHGITGFRQQPFLHQYLDNEEYDMLHGFLPEAEGTIFEARPEYNDFSWAEVDWFIDRLSRGQQDDLFFLPSIGTMIMSLSPFTDVSLSLRQYFGETGHRIESVWRSVRKVTRLKNHAPWFQLMNGADAEQGFIDAGGRTDREYFTFFHDWAKSIVTNPDFRLLVDEGALADNFEELLWQAAVTASNRTDSDGNFSITQAIKPWLEFLFQTQQSLGMGQAVRLNERQINTYRSRHNRVVQDSEGNWLTFEENTDSDLEATWFISDIQQQGDARTFFYRLSQVNDEGDVVELDGTWRETELVLMDELGDELEANERYQAYALDYARKHKSSAYEVVMRIALDTYLTMETMLHLMDNKITRNRFTKNQRKDQDLYLADGLPPTNKKPDKKTPGLGEFLCDSRLEYMAGYLASFHALYREGAKGIEILYGSDLLKAELSWYSANIATRMDRVTEEAMGMAQQELVMPPGLEAIQATEEPPTISLVANLTPQTVFYRIDAPLLRSIYEEYSRRHNNFIIRASRAIDRGPQKEIKIKDPKKKKKVKLKPLLPKLWSMVEQNLMRLFDMPDFRPHQLWESVRLAMEGHRARYGPARPISPPEWAATVFWSELESNPLMLGGTIDFDENRARLKEFVAFIKLHYYSDYTLLSSLATIVDVARINSIKDLPELRAHMLNRVLSDNKDTLLGYTKWPAFRNFVYVMRQFIATDARQLGETVAAAATDVGDAPVSPPESPLPPLPPPPSIEETPPPEEEPFAMTPERLQELVGDTMGVEVIGERRPPPPPDEAPLYPPDPQLMEAAALQDDDTEETPSDGPLVSNSPPILHLNGNPHIIVVADIEGWGPQGFYQRSGEGGVRANPHAVAGDFVPFDGLDTENLYGVTSSWFNKHRFTSDGRVPDSIPNNGYQTDQRELDPPFNPEYAGWGNEKFWQVGVALKEKFSEMGILEDSSVLEILTSDEVNEYLSKHGASYMPKTTEEPTKDTPLPPVPPPPQEESEEERQARIEKGKAEHKQRLRDAKKRRREETQKARAKKKRGRGGEEDLFEEGWELNPGVAVTW